VSTQDPAPSESEEPLIEPEVPLRAPDFAALDTDRILRETGSIPLPRSLPKQRSKRSCLSPKSPKFPSKGQTRKGYDYAAE